MRRDLAAITVSPHADTLEVLNKMQRNGSSRLLVTEGDRLVGIITLTDLLGYLSLMNELEGFEENRTGSLPSRHRISGHISSDHLAGKA